MSKPNTFRTPPQNRSHKRTIPCPHNEGIQCSPDNQKCASCGWNPTVAKARHRRMGIQTEPSRQASPRSPPAPSRKRKRKRNRKRRYTDEQLFTLWQEGKTDEQIGQAVGVSRQYIQRWRDQMHLPSTSKSGINTQKYRLARLQDGTSVAVRNDEV